LNLKLCITSSLEEPVPGKELFSLIIPALELLAIQRIKSKQRRGCPIDIPKISRGYPEDKPILIVSGYPRDIYGLCMGKPWKMEQVAQTMGAIPGCFMVVWESQWIKSKWKGFTTWVLVS
jgi:hypothetical protein